MMMRRAAAAVAVVPEEEEEEEGEGAQEREGRGDVALLGLIVVGGICICRCDDEYVHAWVCLYNVSVCPPIYHHISIHTPQTREGAPAAPLWPTTALGRH